MAEIPLEDAPRKARDMFEKGFAAMERGNLDYAMDMLSASVEIEPRLLHARKFLRAAEIKKFKDSKAGAAKHAISSITGIGTVLAAQAAMKKNPAQALKLAERLMRIDPLNVQFIHLLGQAAVAAGMPEVAVQTLEIARDHYPKNADLLEWLARLYLDMNKTHEARLCFEDLARMKPNDQKVIKMLKDSAALDTMRKGGWDDAGSYRDVMKDSREATLLEQEAKAVKTGKDLQDLIREMRGKIEREPENINYKRALADFMARAEQFDESLAILVEAQKVSGRADPQIDRQISSIRIKQFDHDIAALRAAGDEAGAEARSQEKAAFLLEDAADRVRRYPNDLQFHYDYGVVLHERGRLNEAIQEFQLSQRNPQRRTRSLYYLALSFRQKNQFDIAMEQLEKAASELNVLDDTKKDILYEMGVIAELMGQKDKAIQYFKEIYSVDIQYKDVAARIEKAYQK